MLLMALVLSSSTIAKPDVPLTWAVCSRYQREPVTGCGIPSDRQVRFDSFYSDINDARIRAFAIIIEGACYQIGNGTSDEECIAGPNIRVTIEDTTDANYCNPNE